MGVSFPTWVKIYAELPPRGNGNGGNLGMPHQFHAYFVSQLHILYHIIKSWLLEVNRYLKYQKNSPILQYQYVWSFPPSKKRANHLVDNPFHWSFI